MTEMKRCFFSGVVLLSTLIFMGSEARAQGDVPRYEIGGQFSLIYRTKPTSQDDQFVSLHVADPGVGARFTYNLTNEIAVESEGNFFPGQDFEEDGAFFTRLDNTRGYPSGHILQSQFGVKIGKRFKKFGVFGKLRPGFVRFSNVSQFDGYRNRLFFHPTLDRFVELPNAEFHVGKETYFSTDIGGVVEFYPSRRIVTRFDVGDTIIRYGPYREAAGLVCVLSAPCPTQLFERPAETRHNLQFSAGIGFRL
jgi:hypothetical protein